MVADAHSRASVDAAPRLGFSNITTWCHLRQVGRPLFKTLSFGAEHITHTRPRGISARRIARIHHEYAKNIFCSEAHLLGLDRVRQRDVLDLVVTSVS